MAVAFFPFAQETANAWFSFLNQSRSETIAQAQEDRDFLESLRFEARSKNLEERIILAEFYAIVPTDEDTRERWENFLAFLNQQRDAANEKEVEATRARLAGAAEEDIAAAVLEVEARQLRDSADVGGTPVIDPGLTSFASLLQQLDSSDPLTRRRARSDLGRLGLDLVRPATVALMTPDLSYRLRLGLAVALAEMLRDAKGQRAEAIAQIDDASLRQLLLLSTDVDRTIRIYAGEFLYDLGDPRVFRLVAGVWAEAPSDDGRYNLALAMKGAAPFVPTGEREGARDILGGYIGGVGPQTDVLLRDAVSLLR